MWCGWWWCVGRPKDVMWGVSREARLCWSKGAFGKVWCEAQGVYVDKGCANGLMFGKGVAIVCRVCGAFVLNCAWWRALVGLLLRFNGT